MALSNSESNDVRLSKLEAYLQEHRDLLDTVNHFTVKEFADLFTRSNELFIIVDCRSDYAYKNSHIPQAITLSKYQEQYSGDKIPIPRTIFYGQLGDDTVSIVKNEIKRGAPAYNLEGGLIGWTHYCRFMDDEYEKPAKSIVISKESQQWQKDTIEALLE